MKIRTASLCLALVILFCGASLASEPAGERGPSNPFRDAYTQPNPPMTRADLLACKELKTAVITDQQHLDITELRDMLSGTWVRELTWNGVVVENESGFYYDLRDGRSVAMMFDRSNLGGGPLFEALQHIRAHPKLFVETPRLTFVDCEYDIVDTYFKISDEIVLGDLPVGDLVRKSKDVLTRAWGDLVEQSYFDLDLSKSDYVQRRAAHEPGAELLTPSLGGALWDVSFEPVQIGKFMGATMVMKGEYRGTHVGDVDLAEDPRFAGESVRFSGTETAQWFKDGDAYVVSARSLGASETRAGLIAEGWLTDCANFFELPHAVIWERVVLQPGR